MMTASYGFGMLAVGLIAISIGATVAFWIINKLEENKKQESMENAHLKEKERVLVRSSD